MLKLHELYFKIKKRIFGIKSEEYLNMLRDRGAEIGKKVYVYDTKNVVLDSTRPWLLSIGEYTKITRGVIILTHDYSLSVLRRRYGEWLGEGRITHVGKNCFLGVNSVILMGTSIGDNCIIGAGSIVSGTFPDNVVIAGNPAKIVKTLDEYYYKRKKETIEEARECAYRYYQVFGVPPKPKDLANFKWLFAPRSKEELKRMDIYNFNCTGDEPKEVEESFFLSAPIYESFESFLKDSLKEIN